MQDNLGFIFGELRVEHVEGAPLPIRHTEVDATLFGPVAKVQITQHFYNPKPHPIEAVYVLPLSHQGAVSGLSLWVGGRCIKGSIREVTEAKITYQEALQKGAPAALLTQERPSLFSLSVANIAPNETVRVELSLDQLLPFESGRWRLVVPLTYVPPYRPQNLPNEPWMSAPHSTGANGGQLNTPLLVSPKRSGAHLSSEGAISQPTVSVSVQGSFATPLSLVKGVSYELEDFVQSLDEGTFSLALAAKGEAPDRDFILEIWPRSQTISPVLLSHKAKDKTGTFSLTLLPEQNLTPESFAPREVFFLLDRSGSMQGTPIEQARRALQGCLRALGPSDTFSIISFHHMVHELCEAPLYWSQKTLQEADAYLATISATGGTELIPALERVLSRPQDPLRQRLMVLLTDGGVANEQQAISLIEKRLPGTRAYSFGIGSSINRALLDSIARVGQGAAEYISTGQEIEEALLRFQTRTAGPILTDLKLTASPSMVFDVYPMPLPDLFAGQSLQITGRFTGDEPVTLLLSGRRGAQLFEGRLTLSEGEEPLLGAALNRLWAKRRVEHLQEEMRRNPSETSTLRQEILGLGVLHHIMTPFTALIAVEEEVAPRRLVEPAERVLVPNLLPKGVDANAFSSGWLAPRGQLSYADLPEPRTTSGRSFAPYQPAEPLPPPVYVPAPPPKPAAPPSPAPTPKKGGGGIFARIGGLFRSNINDAIGYTEDPEKMLNQVILEMIEQMVQAKKQIAVTIAEEKRIQKQYEDSALQGSELEKKAMLAIRANDETQAKENLIQKAECDKRTEKHLEQLRAQKDATEKLKNALRGLQNKIDEAKRKKDLLIARRKRAESQQSIQVTMNGLSDTSAFDTFERMSQKPIPMEAEAESLADLSMDPSGTLDAKFAQLQANSGPDDALAELKAKMGLYPAVPLPSLPQVKINLDAIPLSHQPDLWEDDGFGGKILRSSPPNTSTPKEAPKTTSATSSQASSGVASIPEALRILGRTQRASGAWGEEKDDLPKTCKAVAQMAAAQHTHRAGSFQVQLTRAMAFLQAQLPSASQEERLLLAWTFYLVSLATEHPADQALWRQALSLLSNAPASEKLTLVQGTKAATPASVLERGLSLFFAVR